VEPEHVFEFVEQGEGIAGGPVELVHEGEDRDAALAADLEELAGLGFRCPLPASITMTAASTAVSTR
jgi:hypothetical protein